MRDVAYWPKTFLAEIQANTPDHGVLLQAARALNPKTLLPFHWEFWRNHTGSLVKLFEAYDRDQFPFSLQLLLIGDRMQLASDLK